MRRIALSNIFALPIVVLLAACQPQAPDGSAAQAPADAPAEAPVDPELSGDLDLRGTEPFWAASLRAAAITLSRAGEAEVTAPDPQVQAEGEAVVWRAGPLTARVRREACSDGMSDLAYPLAAEVEFAGIVLKGCGAPAGKLPREGG